MRGSTYENYYGLCSRQHVALKMFRVKGFTCVILINCIYSIYVFNALMYILFIVCFYIAYYSVLCISSIVGFFYGSKLNFLCVYNYILYIIYFVIIATSGTAADEYIALRKNTRSVSSYSSIVKDMIPIMEWLQMSI